MRYQQGTYNFVLSLLFLIVSSGSVTAQDTFFDDFNDNSGYTGNDGNQDWNENWDEDNDGNNATNGRILVTGNRLRFEDLNVNSELIDRSANLEGATFAQLSFDWQTIGLDSDGSGNIDNRERLDVQISSNNGGSYTTIGSFVGTATGSFQFDITSFISANTRVRFINTSPWGFGDWEGGEFVFIDNLEIETDRHTISNGGTVSTCSGVFVDSGGVGSNYSSNENFTYTICPDVVGNFTAVDFTSFDVETRNSLTQFFDRLDIYDNDTNSGTFIGSFDNFNPPSTIVATNGTGCLTFQFISDGSVTLQGWEAMISCTNGAISIDNVTVNEADGNATFTITLAGAPGLTTIDYSTEDNTALALSDYTATSGSLIFAGVSTIETQTITVPLINNVFGENTESFFVNISNVSNPLVLVGKDQGIGTIIDDGDPALNNDIPLFLFDEFNGLYDYALTAGTFRTADENVDPCAITSTSSNTLTTTIPVGSTIDKAYLIWGHSHVSADDVVTFEGQNVTADVVNTAFGSYYGMVSDVTSIIQGIPDPSTNVYDVTGLTIDNGLNGDALGYCSGTVVFGGWSLFIFYTNPSLPAVSINMYNGFDGGTNTNTDYTLSGFFAIGSSGSKTSILSWEGDRLRTGNEVISVTTSSGTTELTGDGNNNPPTLENVFNATIYDNTASPTINDSSLFGFDLDTYDISSLITQGETTATTNVETGDDFVILNSVLLKVPSNLITGRVFEDINYGGGAGRDLASSGGVGLANVRVELYDAFGNLEDFDITDANGYYNLGGMPNGTYNLRVANTTIRSNRDDAPQCGSCIPVQTYRTSYSGNGTFNFITDEVGGANPAGVDTPVGSAANPQLFGAQTSSIITILNEGVVDIDFGFTYNAIVNTNPSGQGSLAQFITNANQLDSDYNGGTLIDIEPNSIFDPAQGEEVSVFMIPPTADPLGRTADANYNASGYFDIEQPNGTDLPEIFGENIHIDGRTQTAYMTDRNTGIIGFGGTAVGTNGVVLPNYELPEIQIHQDDGDVIRASGANTVIRNLAIFADQNAGIFSLQGSPTITQNLIGVNALGVASGNIDRGINLRGTTNIIIDGNYIAENTDRGIFAEGTATVQIQNNHITNNGDGSCFDNIRIQQSTDATITNNLIENADAAGIDAQNATGTIIITGNTIRNSGQNGGACGTITENMGIKITGSNTTITNNIINDNGGAGIVLGGGTTSGNLISQNSIYANGTATNALGIDIDSGAGNVDGNGVTINDNGDGDGGPNGSLNFPIFETATVRGETLRVTGWSPPGATIELFLTDITQGTANSGDNQLGRSIDYGEGQVYLATVVEGSPADTDTSTSSYTSDGFTETTNRFNFTINIGTTIPLPGNFITSTATLSNSTSEFSGSFPLGIPNVITNRRITYRVTPPIASITGGITGTLTSDITADNFQDGNNGAPFSIIFRNTTTNTIANYEILIRNVPYAIIPGLVLGAHTITTTNNGNGTYNHLFSATSALGASQSRIISGGVPAPAGTGTSCGCITFYKN